MKKSLIILVVILSNSWQLFSQETKNNKESQFIYPQFHESFSAEESWQIHREAYRKQLKATGFSDMEIEKKMTAYEKEKILFIEKINEQRKLAEIQRKEAEQMRKEAEGQRKKAEEFRKEAELQMEQADVLRKQAEESRKQSEIARKKSEEQRKLAENQREQATKDRQQAEKQREEANIQRKKAEEMSLLAEEQRKLATIQRQQAEKQREEANIQRKKAEEMRLKAEEQRKKAEELRNSFETILTKNIEISSNTSSIEPIVFKIDKKTSLQFRLQGRLSSGNILMEIFSPKGEKYGELSLDHQPDPNLSLGNDLSKNTSGYFSKTLSDVEIGEWKIRISPKKAEGTLGIYVARYIKPAIDE